MAGSIYYQFRDKPHADAMVATLDGSVTAIKVGVLLDENGAAISGYLVHVYDPDDDLPIEDWLQWVVSIAEPPHVIAGREDLQAEGAAWGDDVSLAVIADTVPARVPLTDAQKEARAARQAANAPVSAQVKIAFAEVGKRKRLAAQIGPTAALQQVMATVIADLVKARAAKVAERDAAGAIAQDTNETGPNRQAARIVRDAANDALALIDVDLAEYRAQQQGRDDQLTALRAERDQSIIDIAAMRVVLTRLRAERDAALLG